MNVDKIIVHVVNKGSLFLAIIYSLFFRNLRLHRYSIGFKIMKVTSFFFLSLSLSLSLSLHYISLTCVPVFLVLVFHSLSLLSFLSLSSPLFIAPTFSSPLLTSPPSSPSFVPFFLPCPSFPSLFPPHLLLPSVLLSFLPLSLRLKP